MDYSQFFDQILIPWLCQGDQGKKFFHSWGEILTDQATNVQSAVAASFPNYAPDDAMNFLADDFGLVQGAFPPSAPAETNNNFRNRLVNAWTLWRYAGSPLGLLLSLYFIGYKDDVTIVQQNGMKFKLNTDTISNVLTDYNTYLDVGNTDADNYFFESLNITLTGTFTTNDTYLFNTFATGATLVKHEGAGTGTIAITGNCVSNHSVLITITNGTGPEWNYVIDNQAAVVEDEITTITVPIMIPWWTFDGRRDLTNRYSLLFTTLPSWWTNITNPASPISEPSISEVNTIWKCVQLYGPGKARCMGIQVMVLGGSSPPDILFGYPFGVVYG